LKDDFHKYVCKLNQLSQDLQAIMHVQMQDRAELPVPEPKRRAPFTLPRKVLIPVQAIHKSDAKSEQSK
jgi:hypothetical protein